MSMMDRIRQAIGSIEEFLLQDEPKANISPAPPWVGTSNDQRVGGEPPVALRDETFHHAQNNEQVQKNFPDNLSPKLYSEYQREMEYKDAYDERVSMRPKRNEHLLTQAVGVANVNSYTWKQTIEKGPISQVCIANS